MNNLITSELNNPHKRDSTIEISRAKRTVPVRKQIFKTLGVTGQRKISTRYFMPEMPNFITSEEGVLPSLLLNTTQRVIIIIANVLVVQQNFCRKNSLTNAPEKVLDLGASFAFQIISKESWLQEWALSFQTQPSEPSTSHPLT